MNNNTKRGLTPSIVAILIIGSLFFMIAILYIENSNSKKAKMESLEMIGKAYSKSLQSFRSFYSQVILEKVQGSDIEVTHQYIGKENALPIPATMTMDLINFFNSRNVKVNLRLTSEYPFSWRKNRIMSINDKSAIKHFKTTSDKEYSKIYPQSSIYEYAIPIRMTADCVRCHNTHADSPKKDWKIGDLRGVQIISLESDVIGVERTEERIYFIIAILLFFTFNLSIIIWLMKKNNFAFGKIVRDKKLMSDALKSAETANKTKNIFLANMSHEIRTPLNAIIGFSDILTEAKLEENEHNQAQIISKSSKSLLTIINEILDYSKIESGKLEINPEPASLSELLEHLYALFNLRATESGINLHYNLEDDMPDNLIFDVVRMQQVLSNLLANAIKFTPKDGDVWLTVNVTKRTQKSIHFHIEVKDNGIGIPQEKQELVFKPFSQADSSVSKNYGGTGLGLTIVSKILHLMGSQIHLESSQSDGSKFFFDIELYIDKTKKIEQLREKNKQIEQSSQALKGEILVAEDNPINRQLMEAMLKKISMKADFANDGDEAIRQYQLKNYDLIFMDINMPNCDGLTATKKIRDLEMNLTKHTPIVALTANVIKGDTERFLEGGMDGHLGKPIMFDKLNETLSLYLETFQLSEEKSSPLEVYTTEMAGKNLGLDNETVTILLDDFFLTLPADLEKIKGAIDAKNSKEIYAAAHYLKGACLNFSMDESVKLLLEMERKASLQESEGYDFESLNKSIEKVKTDLNHT